MRRHARATSAGSNSSQGSSFGLLVHGAFATPGASLDSKGRGALAARRAAFLSLALLITLLLSGLGAGSALAAAPAISATTVSAVTAKTAVLEAAVNPEGEATTYHFEYGSADCSSNPCTSIPVPDASVGSGSSALRLTREVTGLQPETTYHLRVVATNGSGSTEGSDRTFTTYPLATSSSGCPNQASRFALSANLPDCRAYEMVSPVEKNGGDIVTLCNVICFRTALNQSSASGDKFTFSSYRAFAGAPSGHYSNQYLATREAGGWVTKAIGAPQGRTVSDPSFSSYYDLDNQFKAFSGDLSSAWLIDDNLAPLTSDALAGVVNLYRLDNQDASFEAVTKGPPFAPPPTSQNLELQGVSADGSHAVFKSMAALTPDAIPSEIAKVYDLHEGQLHLVSVLPDGSPEPGEATAGGHSRSSSPATAGYGERDAMRMHAVSADGSHIFWSSGVFPAQAKLYVRIDDTTTVPVSETEGSQFWTASSDGSKVIYSLPGIVSEQRKLYLFDVDTETQTLISEEAKGLLGTSSDLSYIYYASKEALDAGATAGESNLYLYHEGTSSFIATLSSKDSGEGSSAPNAVSLNPIFHNSRATPDGRRIAFMSTRPLTGYDNTDAVSGEADFEVFTYAADTGELTCISCNPSGASPLGHRMQEPYVSFLSNPEGYPNGEVVWGAAWIPTQENSLYAPRSLSEDGGHIFFNSFDSLVPQDNNGKQDVYQWEEKGKGGCQKAGGCVALISSGESGAQSEFVDATPNGGDVFFSTQSSLVSQDPGQIDIYDARSGGGYPPPQLQPTACVGDACQNIPAAPNDPTPASASFHGAGDLHEGKARRNCRPHKHQAKAGKRAQRKRAKSCRRATRRAGR